MSESIALPEDLTAAISGATLMILSVPCAPTRATIARCGAAAGPDGLLDLFVSAAQWPDTAAHAAPGVEVAAAFVNPASYRCWQVKGPILSVDTADAGEVAAMHAYIGRLMPMLSEIGITGEQMANLAGTEDIRRLRMAPRDVFNQTPGPGAGARVCCPGGAS